MTAVAFTAFAGSAYAGDSGEGYFGLSFGQADVKDFCENGLDSCDDTAFTGRIHGGVHLNSYTDVEFGYRYIDDVDASVSVSGVVAAAEAKGHFLDATVQFGIPGSGPFQVFAKAGAMYWLIDYSVSATNGVVRVSGSDEEDGAALRTGIGARYDINKDVSLRADWDYLVDVGNNDIGETDIQVFSFGPEVRF